MAQSHAAGDGFARYWMHNGLVGVTGEKMSKSLGNSLLVDAVVLVEDDVLLLVDAVVLVVDSVVLLLVEAVVPGSMEAAWDAWEPLLTAHGYRFAFFDRLNRFAVIVVNSLSRPDTGWGRSEAPPGLIAQLIGATGKFFPRERIEDYLKTLHGIAPLILIERQNVSGRQLRVQDPARLAGKRVLVVTGTEDIDHAHEVDGAIVHWLNGHGARAEFCFLADRGIVGGLIHWLAQGLGVSGNADEDFIKRVIGLPGDHISCSPDGSVYINGKKLDEPYETQKTQCSPTTVPQGDLHKAQEVLRSQPEFKDIEIRTALDVAKVSVVGIGMRSHAGVAQKMFQTLADKNINIQVISTSEIKISVLIAKEYLELAVRALHAAYGLEGKAA